MSLKPTTEFGTSPRQEVGHFHDVSNLKTSKGFEVILKRILSENVGVMGRMPFLPENEAARLPKRACHVTDRRLHLFLDCN